MTPPSGCVMTPEEYDAYLDWVVAQAPPATDEQRSTLARIFSGTRPERATQTQQAAA